MAAPEINGDMRLTAGQRLAYLLRNFTRNISGGTKAVQRFAWQPSVFPGADGLVGTPSPSRWLTEAFLHDQLPGLLPPGEIDALDIGCGSGRTCSLLADAGYRGAYTGIDIGDRFTPEQWTSTDFATRFIEGDAHRKIDGTGPFDLIMSISALEHIPDDARLIERFDALLTEDGVQVHFVPGPAGLAVYLWHGFRQYGTGAVAQRFGVQGTRLYGLGGLFSFLLHLLFITAPEILLRSGPRKAWPNAYRRLLALSLQLDRWAPLLPVIYVVCRRRNGAAL